MGETSSPTISFTSLLTREPIALQRGEISLMTDVTTAYPNAAQPETEAPVYLCLDKEHQLRQNGAARTSRSTWTRTRCSWSGSSNRSHEEGDAAGR